VGNGLTTELRKITPEELKEVLRLHRLWIHKNPGGIRADLSYTDLSHTDLINVDLTGADLIYSNLFGVNLTCANLFNANLYGANLTHCRLASANLSRAILTRANLTGAHLFSANFTSAILASADLTDTNLNNVCLNGANLTCATIDEKEIARRCICPVGKFIAYKKVYDTAGELAPTILKLEVPANAIRVGGLTSRKCRANKVKVLEAIGTTETSFRSRYDSGFVYTVGKCAKARNFNSDPRVECAAGIHFFLTKIEAEEY